MFVDETKLKIVSGKGGDGAVCFRHEKFIDKGGPSGGDGGKGGSIYFVASKDENTLLPLRYRMKIAAEDGENGKIKNMSGKAGDDVTIRVPQGTLIFNQDSNELIADITEDGLPRLILEGGKGGLGNQHFANSRNHVPDFAQPGELGKELNIRLELRVLADVGLVGYPSVGKSTILSVISEAKPKIAAYQFTTLQPNLGMVMVPDGRTFVCADLPGLIEGASKGLGLGFEFLRHIERTKVILHVLDGSKIEGNLFQDYVAIRKELETYDPNILLKGEIIVINKSDSEEEKDNEKAFVDDYKKALGSEPKYLVISALQKKNINELLYKTADLLDEEKKKQPIIIEKGSKAVEYTFKPEGEKGFKVSKDETMNVYIVEGVRIDEIMRTYDSDRDESVMRVTRALRKMGVEVELKKIGCQNGDTVRIGSIEFEFND